MSTSCQTHNDLRQAYGEAVETLRNAMLIAGEAAGYTDEPQVYTSAQEQVAFQRVKCETLLKTLKTHVSQHQCAVHAPAWSGPSRS